MPFNLRPSTAVLVAAAGLAPSLIGQTVVYSPAAFAKVAGNTHLNSPIALGDRTWQQLHDGLPPMSIRSMTFRRASGDSLRTTSRPISVLLEIICSTSPHPSAFTDRVFGTNHGRDRLVVFSQKTIQFPPAPWVRGVRAQPDFFQVPFDRVFPFRGGTLCWQADNVDQAGAGPRPSLDGFAAAPGPNGPILQGSSYSFGTSCGAPSGLNRTHFTQRADRQQATIDLGAMFVLSSQRNPTAIRLGRSELRTAAGVPLPLDLSSLGAPGCTLYTSADLTIPLRATTAFQWRLAGGALRLPYAPLWSQAGLPLYAQGIQLDPSANRLGIRVADARRCDLPVVPPTGHGVRSVAARRTAIWGDVGLAGLIVGFGQL